jgi:D-glycero-D-manno-heptose 1,7-bisphosphate phosphatase
MNVEVGGGEKENPVSTLCAPSSQRRAIFLDRDGVINRMVYNSEFGLVDSPQNVEQFQLLSGVTEAIRLINEMGFLAVVVSNQPGIAKGQYTAAILEAMTRKMHRQLAEREARLHGVYYCLHHPEALLEEYQSICGCRKPRPGLLLKAAMELEIDLRASYMIGDGLIDIQAGAAVGCTTLWIGKLKCDICQVMEEKRVSPDFIAPNLWEAVRLIQRKEVGDGDLPGYLKPCGDRKMAAARGYRRSNH